MHDLTVRPHPLLKRAELQANGLLAAMPQDTLERLLPQVEKVRLVAGDALYNAGDALEYAYFPANTIVTILLKLGSTSTSTQVAVAGHEGLVGLSAFMGSTAHGRALVLITGDAFKIPVAALKAEFDRNGPVMRLLLRYTQAVVTQMAQAVVCNRHHRLDQQLCTWLLASMDRLPQGRPLRVTHEMVARVLGVRRESITDAAAALRLLGLITYSRGQVILLDRAGLRAKACECYQVVKRETDRLLPDRPAT